MINFFLQLHSGWRYVVVLVTILLALYFLYALISKNTKAKQETTFLKIWTGVVDLQITLGVVLLVAHLIDNSKWYYDSFTGHWTTMVIAGAVAHVPAIFKRLNGEPSSQTRRIMGLALPIIFIIIIMVGLQAINLGIFERTG